ncbi:glycosyltransferase family 4 protein [Candidatus Shapirobacteria bacterium CG_4_8_14_3_um_filter_35_11]|uniref:GDP-Man:Man(1)GlcNAc(2)-PP-Dol alpha-1,3-mannosyltransferase n=3 Tax=Candidatus Shapironibacteriota TaxID=1752721 RepID=A0A2M7XMQ1_9BACT|nr:MAG: glycosyltransferase family 4 protein [Candidatus Shapirobacteria bacterium CG_4_10_14_3_um_filter_35_13]PJA50844.1 MAG: glycosyltransferase family 4 protein [Candidatus Shapirobacteria bacterium CG_4_9_14_3_um_filter_36_12]PJC79639.1 MAG: glycosyltransferase family 4 protein [Candidatus Shapirobacteria bacterium CG_4_8_14_3_um_filter_35_11]
MIENCKLKIVNSPLRVALVHDYLNEFGGAERVLSVLSEIYPDAPIYTAFYKKNSTTYNHFKNRQIIPSWVHYIPFFSSKLHSPLRFLTPLIWGSFDFSKYDIVIGSASWYITKGFKKGKNTKEICYCHTPPRWLYGFKTSVEFQKYWPVRLYAIIVGHFMRLYDFAQAQKVDVFVANSKNVAQRIKKFYRRDSVVVYPPVSLPPIPQVKKQDFYLIISRIVGAKGLDLAVKAAVKLNLKLKIVGEPTGYYTEYKQLKNISKSNVEFLGRVSDEELVKLYAQALAFLALSTDEDFGITPVESQLAGTPVIAFRGGGYLESVIENKTGVFFDEPSVDSLISAIKKFQTINFNPSDCTTNAQKFSKDVFVKKIIKLVNSPPSQ